MNRKNLIFFCVAFLFIAIPIIYFGLKYNGKSNLTSQQATKEYKGEASSLNLASGWKWLDIPLPSKRPDGSKALYGKGYGAAQADIQWFCSWISRATDPKLSENERQKALKFALTIRKKYFYTTSLSSDSKSKFDSMLHKAGNGNMDEMKQFFESNCKGR